MFLFINELILPFKSTTWNKKAVKSYEKPFKMCFEIDFVRLKNRYFFTLKSTTHLSQPFEKNMSIFT